MKTYISEIIPRLKQYSRRLDDLALLTNYHWVILNDISNNKVVYIFRSNGQLLISENGKVEKFTWEYLGSNSILINHRESSYLLKQGFFDENILALSLDGSREYVILINETRYGSELNSLVKVQEFLTKRYLTEKKSSTPTAPERPKLVEYKTDKGVIYIPPCLSFVDQPVYKHGSPAPSGKYRIDWLSYIHVEDGKIVKHTLY